MATLGLYHLGVFGVQGRGHGLILVLLEDHLAG